MVEMDLGAVRAVLVDPNHSVRQLIRSALISVGITDVIPCRHVDEIHDIFEEPERDIDLILLGIDGERDDAVAAVRDIRNQRLGENPFLVVMTMTWNPEWNIARPTLEAGTDDLIAAPLTTQILMDRIGNLVVNRKDFVVTMDYVGPERRSATRSGPHDLPGIKVPNSLRYKAIHDETANATPRAIRHAMRTVHTHRVYRIANRFASEIHGLEDMVSRHPGTPIEGRKIREVAVLAAMVKQYIDAENLTQLSRIGDSMSDVMDAVSHIPNPSLRHLEILRLHGHAVAASIQEHDEAAGLLATALDRAADLVKRAVH